MKKQGNNSTFIYVILIIAVFFLLYSYFGNNNAGETVSIQSVAADINAGKVKSIAVAGSNIEVTYDDDTKAISRKEPESTIVEQLLALGASTESLQTVAITIEEPTDWATVVGAGTTVLTIVALSVVAFLFIRQFQGVNNQAMSFGKSRARMFSGDRPTVTFEDVAGIDESKAELREIVEFLKDPQKFINLGARIPKGVLLMGAPGTGKTLLAKAVAGEAAVPFFSISGSEFVEMFVGVGASRVRDLFDQAKRHSPCIVFVDEIDAVGRYRGAGLGGSHDEREQTLNQILVEMDGFGTDTNVIVIAATNRPDILDPALLRPGRFDRRVILDQPDIRGREAIFRVHMRGKPIDTRIDISLLAQSTPGFVGADIENTINEAAILAARRGKKRISMSEFQEAIERVIAGPERRSRVITEEERRIVAYHEAGHAVVAHVLPKCDPVRKVSIVARGIAGGYTLTLPEQDHYLVQRGKILDNMAYALGGRAAEEVCFDDISTGAANDLERVTKMARDMVMRFGMSDDLGPLVYGKKEEMIFLGREISEQRDYSEAMAQKIDSEVQRLVREAYERSKDVIHKHRENLERIVQYLLERETLYTEEFVAAFEGRELPARKKEDVGQQPQGETAAPVPFAAAA